MPIWDGDTACGLCGEVLDRWGDHAICCSGGGDRVSVTTRSATLYALPYRNSPPCLLSWRNPVSFSLLSPLTLATLVPAWPRFSPPPILLVAALLTYGSHVASRDSPRHGTFQSPLSSALPFSPPPTRPWLTSFMRSSLAKTPSRTPPHRLPPWEHPSVRSSWRPAAEDGPLPYAKLSRGFPPSHAPCVALPVAPPVTSASKLHSASAAPSRGKTRVQFRGGHPAVLTASMTRQETWSAAPPGNPPPLVHLPVHPLSPLRFCGVVFPAVLLRSRAFLPSVRLVVAPPSFFASFLSVLFVVWAVSALLVCSCRVLGSSGVRSCDCCLPG